MAHSFFSRDEFVSWGLSFWERSTDLVERVFKSLLQECPKSMQMSAKNWFNYLEIICSQIEISYQEETPSGVRCESLKSGEKLAVTHVCLMGLTDGALRKTEPTALSLADVLSLSQTLGFNLNFPDSARLEFETRWLLGKDFKQVILNFSETDFAGCVCTGSKMETAVLF